MQVKSIAECSKGAFCYTFDFIKLPFVFKTFVLSILEWPLKTDFTVQIILYVLVSHADKLFKQFGPRSGTAKCSA